MKMKRIFGLGLFLFVAVSAIYAGVREYRARNATVNVAIQKEQGHKVIAYYFHGTARCMTCRAIEAYSMQAIQSRFAKALEAGNLVWRVINVEEPMNAHFNSDYRLSTKSVVLVEMEDGIQKKWKNLDRVWDGIDNPDQFQKYIQNEVTAFGGRLVASDS
ncbi:nitrophenyl compound nitroreductase subunit ArsF family protein [Bdellovibrionota bacterium FG-2]